MIRFDNVSLRYSTEAPWAVEGVSLTVRPGRSVALLGANGSGKSTLVRLANALLLPTIGSVVVEGMDTRDPATVRRLRETVGIVFQRPDDQIVATSVEDDIAFGPENLGLPREEIRRRVDEAIRTVGMDGLELREPHLLSGGQKQRLAIAGALAMKPRYLVLDEPTSMLDPHGRAEVLGVIERLRDSGTGILHVTHDLSSLAGSESVVVLRHGSVVFTGGVAELLDREESLDEWGLEAPPLQRLARALGRAGVDVPAPVTVAGMVGALCR